MQAPQPSPCSAAVGGLPVWLPWVLAPGFLLLPVGGCGLAAALRRPHAACSTAGSPVLVPVTTVATVVPPHESVAWHDTAD